jgi:hypothetical protein
MYEMVWKDVVQPQRSQMAVWRMGIACSILKAPKTYSEHVKLTASALQRWLHEHSLMLGYIYIYIYTAWLVGLSNANVRNSRLFSNYWLNKVSNEVEIMWQEANVASILHYSGINLGELKKFMGNLNNGTPCPGRNWNPPPPAYEYKSEALPSCL